MNEDEKKKKKKTEVNQPPPKKVHNTPKKGSKQEKKISRRDECDAGAVLIFIVCWSACLPLYIVGIARKHHFFFFAVVVLFRFSVHGQTHTRTQPSVQQDTSAYTHATSTGIIGMEAQALAFRLGGGVFVFRV